MQKLYLYNTLTRKKEEFKPIKKGRIGLYTCGPTVYNYAHIGNLRTYIFEDILKRVLIYNGYKVKHVMNITDVGHLTGDRDMGEDKLEKGAKREGKTAWEIADFYTKAFKEDMKHLNLIEPDIWCKATDYIDEQIELIKKLEKKGYTYKTSDGIYFNTAKFKDYTKLSHQNLEALQEGARVEKNKEKKNSTDFALWKFSPKDAKRQMEWESPWGIGFPGWHIECSAMSMKCLGDQLDIHCGGIDHINVHHTNEIAQSEAATGKKFFNYWMHGAFLNIAGGKKMAKSEENFLTLENAFIKKGINPLVYRFAALGTHYRKPMEYSEEAIKSAEGGLNSIYDKIILLATPRENNYYLYLFVEFIKKIVLLRRFRRKTISSKHKSKFIAAINDNLNTPKALSVVQELLNSKLSDYIKLNTLFDLDKVLGLNFLFVSHISVRIKEKILKDKNLNILIKRRDKARKEKNWKKSDTIRKTIEAKGYIVEDTDKGTRVYEK